MSGSGDISTGMPPPPEPLPEIGSKRGASEGEMGQRRVRQRRGEQEVRATGLMGKRPKPEEATEISLQRKVKKQEVPKPFAELDVVILLKAGLKTAAENSRNEYPELARLLDVLANSMHSEAEFDRALAEVQQATQELSVPQTFLERNFPPQAFRVLGLIHIFFEQRKPGYIAIVDSFIKNVSVPSNLALNIIIRETMASREEDKLDLLKNTAILCAELPLDRHSKFVVRFLDMVPKEQRVQAIHDIAAIIKESTSTEQLDEILSSFAKAPKEHIPELLADLAKLFKGSSKEIPWGGCLLVISKLPQNQRTKLLPTILNLYAGLDRYSQEKMMKAIYDTPTERIADVIKLGEMFLRTTGLETDRTDRYKVIKALAEIPKKQMADVAKWASQFCTGMASGAEAAIIIRAIGDLIPAERTNILTYSQQLSHNFKNVYELCELIRAVAEIDRRERRDVVKQALPLLQFATSYRADLVKGIAAIDRQNRQEVAQSCIPLLNGITSGSTVLLYMDAVAAIPQVNKQDVIEALWSKLSSINDRELRVRVLKAIAPFDPEQRELCWNMLQTTLQGLTSAQNEFLKELNEIPSERRIATLSETMPSLQGESNGFDASNKLRFWANAPPEIKNYVLRHPELLQGITSHHVSVLLSLLDIASNQLEDLLTPLLPILTSLQNGRDRVSVINAVADLTHEHREPMRLMLSNLLNSFNPEQRLLFFSRLEGFGSDQRLDALRLARPLLQSREWGTEISTIFDRIRMRFPARDELERLLSLSAAQIAESIGLHRPFIDEDSYDLFVVPEELENRPQLLLDKLTKDFREGDPVLHVEFADQAGVDAGGLGRQFFSELFTNLVKKLDCNEIGLSGFYRPKLHPLPYGQDFSFSAEEKKIYNQLGKTMMFCLNATRDYPIGILFDQGFFSAILSFSEPLLQHDFDALDPKNPKVFSELFSIFENMNEHIESELQAAKHMKKYLQPLPLDPEDKKHFLQAIYSIVEDEEDIKALKIPENANLEPYVEQLQGALRDFIFSNVLRPNLAPLHEIARGMSQAPFKNTLSWQDLHKLKPSELSERLQGVLTPQKIVDSLQLAEAIPKERQQWVKNWVASIDDETRKRFLFALTGSRALGKKPIKFNNAPGETAPIYFHTCFNSVDFPFETIGSEGQFRKTLEASLKDPKYNRA